MDIVTVETSTTTFRLVPPAPLPRPLAFADLTAEQQHAVADPARVVLCVGGPGTGKTTALVAGVAARVEHGQPLDTMLVLTHSRPAAQQLRGDVLRAVGRSQVAPQVMTVPGLCHALVRRFGAGDDESRADVTVLTAPEQEFRLRELLQGHDRSHWPDDLAQASTTRSFAAEVRAAIARVRQLGLDPHEVAALGQQAGRVEWQVLGEFFDEYLDVLDSQQALDYAELVHRARLLLLRDDVRAVVAGELSTVWVDEVGECDPSQVQLFADLVQLGCELRAFGDPRTSVFGFRGADRRIFTDAISLFGRAAGPARRVELSLSHRHPPALAEALGHVSSRLPVDGGTAPPRGIAAGRATVEVIVTDSAGAEAAHIAEVLREAHLVDGLAWSSMAVITRSGRGTLPLLVRQLSAAGVPVQVEGDEIALTEEVAVRPLVTALEVVLDLCEGQPLDPERATFLLRSPLGTLDSVGVRRLGRALRRQGADVPVGSAQLIAALVDPRASDPAVGLDGPEVQAARDLRGLLAAVVAAVEHGAGPSATLWLVWSRTDWPRRLEREALHAGEGSARAHRDLDAVMALFDLAARETQLTGRRGLRALIAEVAGQQIPSDNARESDPRDRGVRLMTAHRVKGQQWPLVVVAQVQEGAWPSSRRRGSVLDADRLTRGGVAEVAPWSTQLAEERRLFLLACSRASRHLVVSAVQGTEGEGDQPSRFLDELGVRPRVIVGRPDRATTPAALVAELRRCAVDSSVSPALREHAAARLARLASLDDGRGRPLARSADPATWWGMRDYTAADTSLFGDQPVIELHGSELETLLSCPRHWFLARQARAERPGHAAATFGTVLHAVVDHAEQGTVSLDGVEAHLDRVWPQMQFEAPWLSAHERVEAEAAVERWAAWTEGVGRQSLGTEVRFDIVVPVDGEQVRLAGTVDRLDLDQRDRLRIVDFKTGRSVPPAKEAERQAQLGVYQLAATMGAFDHLAAGVREVGGAELVYLRKQDGQTPWPKVLHQPSLTERPHFDDEPSPRPTWVHDRLADAVRIVRTERFDAQVCPSCTYCPFADSCPALRRGDEVAR